MMKNRKTQMMMLLIMAALLFVAPQVSISLRPKYLYLLFNFLIIALVAESGLLPSLSTSFSHHNDTTTSNKKHEEDNTTMTSTASTSTITVEDAHPDQARLAEEKIKTSLVVVKVLVEKIVEKCPIAVVLPSIFFIGPGNTTTTTTAAVEDEEEAAAAAVEETRSGLELFTKAELFIGNFYNQLKMQSDARAQETY
ncbi:hypothetical protein LINPERPRIM_LOCUS38670 [Linum perenne]